MTPCKQDKRKADFTNFRTTILKDTLLEFPELWMEVYIAADASEYPNFVEMFMKARCTKASSPETADLVVFGGGPDVNPIYYDEKPHSTTHFYSKRDEADLKLYETCVNLGIPMFGVCRGAQFLHVMNGGKLFQHVNNHTGDHQMWDFKHKRLIGKVSSVHHQMCIPNRAGGMEIIADAHESTERWENPEKKSTGKLSDVEAFFYRDTCAFGVQGHPEYRGYHQFAVWTLEQINELIVCSPDLEMRNNVRRMKEDLMAERDARWKELAKELN